MLKTCVFKELPSLTCGGLGEVMLILEGSTTETGDLDLLRKFCHKRFFVMWGASWGEKKMETTMFHGIGGGRPA